MPEATITLTLDELASICEDTCDDVMYANPHMDLVMFLERWGIPMISAKITKDHCENAVEDRLLMRFIGSHYSYISEKHPLFPTEG